MAQEVVVGKALAGVLCGGGDGGPVKESRLLELEREAFLMLCGTDATRARIDHMLSTGKPLRN
jgi:3-hydroxyacyl-CoA dehydrogenase